MPEIVLFENKDAVSLDAAYRFTALAAQAEAAGRSFTVALAGGSTPKLLYSLLASAPCREAIHWDNIVFFFGDERCVPPDATDSNYRMAEDALFAHVPLPAENIHRMRGDLADHEQAAREYEQEIQTFFALTPGELPRFDLILLGMGADGHCASLFPGKKSLHELERMVVAAEPGLTPFVSRLTLTFPVLNNAAHVLFLIAGTDKALTLARVMQQDLTPEQLPIRSVSPAHGSMTYLIDHDAAQLLKHG